MKLVSEDKASPFNFGVQKKKNSFYEFEAGPCGKETLEGFATYSLKEKKDDRNNKPLPLNTSSVD
jgi:hypothetical protein